MLKIKYSNKWDKAYNTSFAKFSKFKRATLQNELKTFVNSIAKGTVKVSDVSKYKLHKLKGDKQNIWEFHLKNDLCVMYEINAKDNTLFLLDIGTHSSLKLNGSMSSDTVSLEDIKNLEFHYNF